MSEKMKLSDEFRQEMLEKSIRETVDAIKKKLLNRVPPYDLKPTPWPTIAELAERKRRFEKNDIDSGLGGYTNLSTSLRCGACTNVAPAGTRMLFRTGGSIKGEEVSIHQKYVICPKCSALMTVITGAGAGGRKRRRKTRWDVRSMERVERYLDEVPGRDSVVGAGGSEVYDGANALDGVHSDSSWPRGNFLPVSSNDVPAAEPGGAVFGC